MRTEALKTNSPPRGAETRENMAGYNGYSKSNNAIGAENDGRFPASKIASMLKVKAGAVKELLSAVEWHHTSKFYNITMYYSLENAEERIEELRAWEPPKRGETVYKNCVVRYLVWGGTRRRPTATEVEVIADVVDTGKLFLQLIPVNGDEPFRKKRDCRGLVILNNDGEYVKTEEGDYLAWN